MKKIGITVMAIIFSIVTSVLYSYFVYLFFLSMQYGLTGYFNDYFGKIRGGYIFFVFLLILVHIIGFIITFVRGLVNRIPLYRLFGLFGLYNVGFILGYKMLAAISNLVYHHSMSLLAFYGTFVVMAIVWLLQVSLVYMRTKAVENNL